MIARVKPPTSVVVGDQYRLRSGDLVTCIQILPTEYGKSILVFKAEDGRKIACLWTCRYLLEGEHGNDVVGPA